VAYFVALSCSLPGGTEESHDKKLGNGSRYPDRDANRAPPQNKSEAVQCDRVCSVCMCSRSSIPTSVTIKRDSRAFSQSRHNSYVYVIRARPRRSRVRSPAETGNFSLHHRVQISSGAHPAYYPMGTRCSFPGGKAAGASS
jgi:hypothetical protein